MARDYLPIALRAYAEPTHAEKRTKRRPSTAGPHIKPRLILCFDTETTTDHTQRFVFGSYRLCRATWDGNTPHIRCFEEGLFYADDLPGRDPKGFDTLRRYVTTQLADVELAVPRLRFWSQQEFLKRILYRYAYKKRATVVAFNLPFDISRIAYGCGDARGRFSGGFSLALWGYRDRRGEWHDNRYRPRIDIKTIDSKRHLIGFASSAEDRDNRHRGQFLDLRTLAFAVTNEDHSLASACQAFGVEHGKVTSHEHGRITDEYIDYNRRDVKATVELCLKQIEEYVKHPIDLQPTKAYSPASIGKAYLRAMGIQPILARQPNFSRDVLGYAMTAYYGGRAECRIRRVAVPVVYLDFLSMYPTVCALMGLWDLLTCERIEVEDATDEATALLGSADLVDKCFHPQTWRRFAILVQVVPNGDVLPARAEYAEESNWQIGVNPFTGSESQWYTLPDMVASALLTGRPPRILRAIRFVPYGISSSLRPVSLRRIVSVDPRTQDFFKSVIEERARVKARKDIPEEERRRLESFLKVLANATSYGIFAEMVRTELPGGQREEVRVYGLDTPFTVKVTAPEYPGGFAFPPMAACITGAARLMLTLLERLVTDAGGTYAFCDTDSMAIVATEKGGLNPCPGGPERLPDGGEAVHALSWAQVEDIRQQFATLNPYNQSVVPGSILRLEVENLDKTSRRRQQLWCYAISAKRYALYTLDRNNTPLVRKLSEHGLGHLLNPIDPDDLSRDWIRVVWEGIVTEALGQPFAWPHWQVRPAVGRITVSSPSLLRLFAHLNHGNPYADQIKPFNFLLTAFVDALGHPEGMEPEHFQLLAPWTPDPSRWLKLDWIDRYSAEKFRIRARGDTGGDGVARVKTYADIMRDYRVHPEPKSLGPSAEPCSRHTRGLLRRRPVIATEVRYIGKESNKLDDREADIVHDLGEVMTEYQDPRRDPFHLLVLPVLRNHPTTDIAKVLGLDPTTTRRILGCRSQPRPEHKSALVALAVRAARDSLRDWGIIAPTDDMACCVAFLEERTRRALQFCPVCHGPLTRRGSRYCSAACKQRAYRLRKNRSLRSSPSSLVAAASGSKGANAAVSREIR